MNHKETAIIISRIVLWIGVIMIFIGIIHIFFITANMSDMPTIDNLYYENTNQLSKKYWLISILGLVPLLIGFCLSFITEKKRYLTEEHPLSKSFSKDIFLRYVSFLFISLVLYIPSGCLGGIIANYISNYTTDYAGCSTLLYCCFTILVLALLSKEINALYKTNKSQ